MVGYSNLSVLITIKIVFAMVVIRTRKCFGIVLPVLPFAFDLGTSDGMREAGILEYL